jgi:CoA:oxalate CoA-transferase
LTTPQAQARGLLTSIDDERLPGLRLPLQPVKFTGSAANVAARAPGLGEHSEHVMAELLGLGAERIAELAAAGLFGERGHTA